MTDAVRLKELCDKILSDQNFKPTIDDAGNVKVTHCNSGAFIVAEGMGCLEFRNLAKVGQPIMANQMHELMAKNDSGKWVKAQGDIAAHYAQEGGLAFAALPGSRMQVEHGHIAALYPDMMQFSGSLGKDVPMLANIGKTVGKMKASAAFPVHYGEPDYFMYKS